MFAVATLAQNEIVERLKKLNGWTVEKGQLHKAFVFRDFREALGFVVRVGLIAEPMDHHPDIDIRYKKVILNVITHSDGGLTEKDFNLAKEIDAI